MMRKCGGTDKYGFWFGVCSRTTVAVAIGVLFGISDAALASPQPLWDPPQGHHFCRKALASILTLAKTARAATTSGDVGPIMRLAEQAEAKSGLSALERSLYAIRSDRRAEFAHRWKDVFDRLDAHLKRVNEFLRSDTVDLHDEKTVHDALICDATRLINEQLDILSHQESGLLEPILGSDQLELWRGWKDESGRAELIAGLKTEFRPRQKEFSTQFLEGTEVRNSIMPNAEITRSVVEWLRGWDPILFAEQWVLNQSDLISTLGLFLSFDSNVEEAASMQSLVEEAKLAKAIPTEFLSQNWTFSPPADILEHNLMLGIVIQTAVQMLVEHPRAVWFELSRKAGQPRWLIARPDYQIIITLDRRGGVTDVALQFLDEREIAALARPVQMLVRLRRAERNRLTTEPGEPPHEQMDAAPRVDTSRSPELRDTLESYHLVSEFETFLLELANRLSLQPHFVETIAGIVGDVPALQSDPRFRSRIERAMEADSDVVSIVFELRDLYLDLRKRSVAGELDMSEAPNLNTLLSDPHFDVSQLVASTPYSFTFVNGHAGTVIFRPQALRDLASVNAHVAHRYLLKFLRGPVASRGRQGLKRLDGNEWEIKYIGHSHRRMIVNHDSQSGQWTIEREIEWAH